MSSDGREIYFTSDRAGTPDIWMSTRAAVGQPWSTPAPVTAVNSAAQDLHPAISADGTTLFFVSNRGGNTDIYVSKRTVRRVE